MIEIWMRDEYGQANIQGRVADFNAAIMRGHELLDSYNMDNALTAAEKDKNWECFIPICTEAPEMIYGGRVRGTVDFFFDPKDGTINETKSARIILGKKNGQLWYAKDHKNKELDSLNDNNLSNKAYIFFKKV